MTTTLLIAIAAAAQVGLNERRRVPAAQLARAGSRGEPAQRRREASVQR